MTDITEAPQVQDLVSPVTATGQMVRLVSSNGISRTVDSSLITAYNFFPRKIRVNWLRCIKSLPRIYPPV